LFKKEGCLLPEGREEKRESGKGELGSGESPCAYLFLTERKRHTDGGEAGEAEEGGEDREMLYSCCCFEISYVLHFLVGGEGGGGEEEKKVGRQKVRGE